MADTVSEAQRLYVSAPSDLDLRPLLDGLKRRGADPYVLSDVAPLGADIAQSLRFAISRADRVLVVLTDKPALNPALEAGIALALGKPLLIIAAPGSSIPSDLKGQLIAQGLPTTSMPSTMRWTMPRRPRHPRRIAAACPGPLDALLDGTGRTSCWPRWT